MPAEVGQRRILRLAVTVDRSQLQVARGLRNAVGVVVPLAIGAATGEIAGGIAVAGGGLLVGFAEQGAPFAGRARGMLVATALVGGSTLVGTVTGDIDWLTVLLMALGGFAAGFTLALGQTASFQGILGVLALLLSAYYSGGLDDGLERAGLAIAIPAPSDSTVVALRHSPEGTVTSTASFRTSMPPPCTTRNFRGSAIFLRLRWLSNCCG